MRIYVSLSLLGVLTCGCAILGRQQKDHAIDAGQVAKVQKGMSREEVATLLGAPQEIIFSHKEHDPLREHAYVYQHTRTKYTALFFLILSFGNSDEKRDRVLVFFDEEGRVEHVGASLYADQSAYGFPFGR
jgi:outer membrane protein assembly factor BamE (lipoprotein component of BamABCDE complex)